MKFRFLGSIVIGKLLFTKNLFYAYLVSASTKRVSFAMILKSIAMQHQLWCILTWILMLSVIVADVF